MRGQLGLNILGWLTSGTLSGASLVLLTRHGFLAVLSSSEGGTEVKP